jgi:spermidine dehydrogenase
MTMYVPFPNPKLPLEAQGPAARQQLYETPFADYEQKVVEQFSAMFGRYGFDAKRDIAGLILNRWGHAYVTPPPGFFFGLGDEPAPLDLATKRHGRVAFGQSGLEDWVGATEAGRRAVQDLSLT